ncbi:MAG: methionine--tRNA ligase [Deltaproteobacteria bacterium]|nr:methionine--tRNA ligase [Deltaproteobacteria bacterium]
MSGAYFVTTPIYYVNASPHIGHAYTTIVADVLARYHRLRGDDAFFLTGTDEHGDKIAAAAASNGVSPQEYADRISEQFRALWPELLITNDHFIRTTDAQHVETVRTILQKVYDAGDIYFGEYGGFYCVGCERFYTEKELVDGKCPDHQTEPEYRKENNYFFRMSKYQDWLIEHIKKNDNFIRPERYRNEVLAFLKEPLEDLCISRPKTRLTWGITLPFDDAYVTYVWFDALINYITALGYPQGRKFSQFWQSAQHLIAKDILKPHGIYWPTMLKAAGIVPYASLNVHGYWNIERTKMSKSLGNVVKPLDLKNKYGLDAFRYFLLRDMVFGLDANFSEEALVQRINTDLANDLGNLTSRVLTMATNYCGGKTPAPPSEATGDDTLKLAARRAMVEYEEGFANLAFHKALMGTWGLINRANKYIVENEPWTLAKSAEGTLRLREIMYNLLEALRIIAILISPVMPLTAQKMFAALGITAPQDFNQAKAWGSLAAGLPMQKGEALFPRVKYEDNGSTGNPNGEVVLKKEVPLAEVAYDDFAKLDLRVGSIVAAEAVPKSQKLLKLRVDIGGEQRQIIAGIANDYRPEEILGKRVVVVANLKPTKLMGQESCGMLLATDGKEGKLSLIGFDKEPLAGAKVR